MIYLFLSSLMEVCLQVHDLVGTWLIWVQWKAGIPISSPKGYEHMRMDNRCPRFRSKYMSIEEIENIARMQQTAPQINGPYIDDYYHQACLAKKISRCTTEAPLVSNFFY
jgi:hypothetical protein